MTERWPRLNNAGLLPVFAEKNADGSVTIWRDAERLQKFVTFPPWHLDCPTRRNRYVTLNCYRWELAWLQGPA